ncbi:AAA family ATPase [Heliorestis acidaminivorans]|uniref:AAA family ATPase n=1 Tax=Heliorestis acidaminivorans TaxID=553427 RepID=A0A6I0EZD9_9FIRM|nr:ATP-binding protein [Heliorestis acidaminivorans]KAB2953876.1 AAA family ATPase [Heliorestis acidaminivorans]
MIDRDTKRLRKQAERDRRVEQVYQKDRKFYEIDQALRLTGIQLVQTALGKITPQELAQLEQTRAELNKAREKRIKTLKLDKNLFEVHWDCQKCQDRGWTDFGVKCTCLIQEEIDQAFTQSGLTEEMKSQNFETFDLQWYARQGEQGPALAERMSKVLKLCHSFTQDVIAGKSQKDLLFYGAVGTGKTHLSSAIANELLAQGKSVVYRSISQIITSIYEAKFDFQNQGRQPEVLKSLRQADLVIIDDLGTEKTTEFVITELFELVNDRQRMGKPLLISTNIALRDLPGRYSLRTADRLITRSICIQFDGTSIRQLRAEKAL